MIVVADTSPLNYLILLRRIDTLHAMYGRILIPHAVLDELLNPDAPPIVKTWAQNPPEWVEFLSPSANRLESVSNLDRGETEAIALAEQMKADWLLIDETAGRKEAHTRGIQVIGTLGILLEAHRLGMLDFASAMKQLRAFGFHVSQPVIQQMLNSLHSGG